MKLNIVTKILVAILTTQVCLLADTSINKRSIYLKKSNWRETIENTLNKINNLQHFIIKR
jgi:hypothetical protein